MFNSSDFKRVIDETAALLDQIKTAPEDDAEDMQLRIDSNIQALRIIGGEIEDPALRRQAQEIIQSFSKNTSFEDSGRIEARLREHPSKGRSSIIDDELLKNTLELKRMAAKFGESLKTDESVLSSVSVKMGKNSAQTSLNIKSLEENSFGLQTSTYLLWAFILFVVMFFVIRFL